MDCNLIGYIVYESLYLMNHKLLIFLNKYDRYNRKIRINRLFTKLIR